MGDANRAVRMVDDNHYIVFEKRWIFDWVDHRAHVEATFLPAVLFVEFLHLVQRMVQKNNSSDWIDC